MTTAATTPEIEPMEPPGIAPGRAGLVLAMVCAAVFMLMLDTTVVSAALADIRKDFGASIDGLQWVIDAYAIPLAGLLLIFATVGDRYGRKRMFIAGTAVFTLASAALAVAGTIVTLDILRAVQGVGAAMLFATTLPLLAMAFPGQAARAKAIGVYGAVMALATVAGPVFGGLLVTEFGWRSIFTINIPIGVVLLVAAVVWLPESARSPQRRTDWLGSLLLTAGLGTGVFCLTRGNALGWGSPATVAMGAAAVALLAGFMVWQFRAAHPLFDVAMLKKPGFAGTAIVSVAHMATLMAATNYLALFLIGTLDYTPLRMGLRLLPISLAAMVAAPSAAVFVARIPIAVSLPVTMAMVALGMWLIGGFGTDDTWTHFVPGMIVGGFGLGAMTAIIQAASLGFAAGENAGMASATFGTFRQVGMAVGVAGLGATFSHVAREEAETGLSALPAVRTGLVPTELTDRFVEAVGAGAGQDIVAEIPARYQGAAPDLVTIAHDASVAAVNALAEVGALVAVAAVGLAVSAFVIGRRATDDTRAG